MADEKDQGQTQQAQQGQQAEQGQSPQGQAPQGQAPQGQAPQGQAPQAAEGQQAPQGQQPQAEAPAPRPQVGAQQQLTVDDATLQRAADQLHSELHTTPPQHVLAAPGAARAPGADTLLGRLVATLGLTAADMESLRALGPMAGKILLSIALRKFGMGL
jgi:hypothetical protein